MAKKKTKMAARRTGQGGSRAATSEKPVTSAGKKKTAKKSILAKSTKTKANSDGGRRSKSTPTKQVPKKERRVGVVRPRAVARPKPVTEAKTEQYLVLETLELNELPASPLTKEDLQYFRDLLLQKRAQIAGDVTALRNQALSDNRQNASGDLSNMPIHMADLGTDNYEKEFTLGLIESERKVLREIDDALKRIDQGTYGVCLATGRPIGKARLKAQPWVQYCYEYMLAQERGQQRKSW